jgi:type IV secretory pathway VirB10-like protein
MDEVIRSKTFSEKMFAKIKEFFVLEPVSFSNKRRLNFRGMAWLSAVFFGFFFIWVMLAPPPESETLIYNESSSGSQNEVTEVPPAATGISSNPLSTAALRSYSSSIGKGAGGNSDANRNTNMIIARENDSSTTLPPGTKLSVRLEQNVSVTAGGMPVIGRITSSVMSQSSVGIPEGSQIFGEATLNEDTERAQISWKSILFPDGRSKSINAIALGSDNQTGVDGDFHSDALKNTAGQMISRFVGGFAEGSISRGAMGASEGSVKNGIFQGVAETWRIVVE